MCALVNPGFWSVYADEANFFKSLVDSDRERIAINHVDERAGESFWGGKRWESWCDREENDRQQSHKKFERIPTPHSLRVVGKVIGSQERLSFGSVLIWSSRAPSSQIFEMDSRKKYLPPVGLDNLKGKESLWGYSPRF